MPHRGSIYITNPGGLHVQAVFPAQLERIGMLMEGNIFGFRIINLPDGTQIIDTTLETSYDALTPVQMVEYVEVDVQLAIMDSMRRIEQRRKERQQKISQNPLYKLACLCRLV